MDFLSYIFQPPAICIWIRQMIIMAVERLWSQFYFLGSPEFHYYEAIVISDS